MAPTLVDLTGKGIAYAWGTPATPRFLRIHIGQGVFLPMSLEEAEAYVSARVVELEAQLEEADREWATSVAVEAASKAKREWEERVVGGRASGDVAEA